MAGLSEDLIAALCPRPCKGPITRSVRRLLPSGVVEVSGEPAAPLCAGCPERHNPKAPPHHIEVRYGYESGGDIGDLADTESTTVDGAGITIINVVHDPRSAHPGR
jgi:hypothetical protein